MKKSIAIFLVLILLSLSIQFVSAGILCDYFGIYCDKNLKGELGSSNPIAVEGSCKDGIDNDNDGKIDYTNDRGCLNANDNNEYGEPIGYLDGVKECNAVYGWSCDPDDFNAVVDVHLYVDGPVGAGGSLLSIEKANFQREPAVGNLCGGNATHGFSFVLPNDIKDGKNHSVYAYAINLGTPANNQELEKYPVYFNCKKEEVKCTDSDDGNNLEIKGKTCVGDDCKEDICDSQNLMEYYCLNNDRGSQSYNCTNGCKDGACVEKIDEVKEQVKCIFNNSVTVQKCYTTEDNSKFFCSGVSSCVVNISGEKGKKLEWKSSCGGYVSTLIDGVDEYAKFDCKTKENKCTDSDGGKNLIVKGKTCIGENCKEDICRDTKVLIEYSCSNNKIVTFYYKCHKSYGCQNSVCRSGDSNTCGLYV